MKPASCLLMALLCMGMSATAQIRSVVAAAGGDGQTSNVRLSWTLGETAVATLQCTNGEFLTEGFQQPEILHAQKVSPGIPGKAALTIAPNPVSTVLTIQIADDWSRSASTLTLFDDNGRQTWNGRLSPGLATSELNLGAHPAGTYWLRIVADVSGATQTFKVIKIQ